MSSIYLNTRYKIKEIVVENALRPLHFRKDQVLEDAAEYCAQCADRCYSDRMTEPDEQCSDKYRNEDQTITQVGDCSEDIVQERGVHPIKEEHILAFFDDKRASE